MNAEYIKLLQDTKKQIEIDLDDLKILMTRKSKQFLKVQTMLMMIDADLTDQELELQEKIVIDCVNVEDPDEPGQ